MKIADDIKTVLLFCEALGFERLPLSIEPVKRRNGVTEKLRHGEKRSLHSRISASPHYDLSASAVSSPDIRVINEKSDALAALREEICACERCKLSKGRKNVVFGEGNPGAELMFIGEGPGREEDLQARPFVGDAGKLLTRLIEKMGLRREDVYIGNIVKCRPPLNRDPEDDEVNECIRFIERQVEIISPKVIVSLGRISAQTLISAKVPISKLRGRFYEYKGIPLMPTFHPAYLLRNPKDKWLVWEDMQKVIEKLKEEE